MRLLFWQTSALKENWQFCIDAGQKIAAKRIKTVDQIRKNMN